MFTFGTLFYLFYFGLSLTCLLMLVFVIVFSVFVICFGLFVLVGALIVEF